MQSRRARIAAAVLVSALVGSARAEQARAPIGIDELMAAVRHLTSPALGGRRTGTPGGAAARAWIAEQFRGAGLSPVAAGYLMPFTVAAGDTTTQGVNVVGLCRGSGPSDGGVMVVSAHYDHLGTRNGATHPGADDNASGVAVLLALARRCVVSPWSHDVVFAAFDAEELGLRGARAFVDAPPVPRERLALNVNLDMLGRSEAGELFVAGPSRYPALRPVLEPVAERAPVRVRFGHDAPTAGRAAKEDDWTMLSDHGAFHAAAIPFVYFGVEDHPDYHQPTDTADRLHPAFFQGVAATVLDAVTALDRALPLLRP